MLKVKHSLWLVLVLFLAACGTQSQVPEIVQGADEIVQLGDIAAQGSPKKDQLRAVFVKKIEGHAPHKAAYKIVLKCTVKEYKGKRYQTSVVTVVAKFNKAGKAQGNVPKKILGSTCILSEQGTLGDSVSFRVVQINKDSGKWDHVDSKWSHSYQQIDSKGKHKVVSEKFELKKKGKVLRVITTNTYKKPPPPPKKLELEVVKVFKKGYNGEEVHPEDYKLELTLVCSGGYKETIKLEHKDGKLSYYNPHADELYGKSCYITEKFYDDKYQFLQYATSYSLGDHKDTVYADSWKQGEYDYAENKYRPFHIKYDHGKLVIVIVNNMKEKEKPKKLELEVVKVFKKGYNGEEVHPEDYKLELTLVCSGGYKETIKLEHKDGKLSYYNPHADELYGKSCYITEKFYDDKYQFLQYATTYEHGDQKQTVYADAWKNHNHGYYDYAENGHQPFYVKYDHGKIVIVIVNNVTYRPQDKPHTS